MRKSLLTILLAFFLIFALAGCKNDQRVYLNNYERVVNSTDLFYFTNYLKQQARERNFSYFLTVKYNNALKVNARNEMISGYMANYELKGNITIKTNGTIKGDSYLKGNFVAIELNSNGQPVKTTFKTESLGYQDAKYAYSDCKNTIYYNNKVEKINKLLKITNPIILPTFFDIIDNKNIISNVSNSLNTGENLGSIVSLTNLFLDQNLYEVNYYQKDNEKIIAYTLNSDTIESGYGIFFIFRGGLLDDIKIDIRPVKDNNSIRIIGRFYSSGIYPKLSIKKQLSTAEKVNSCFASVFYNTSFYIQKAIKGEK